MQQIRKRIGKSREITEEELKKTFRIVMNVICASWLEKKKQEGYRRLCIEEMRLIEQKVSKSPHWCKKRKINL